MSSNYKLVDRDNLISGLRIVTPKIIFDHRGENFEGFDSIHYQIVDLRKNSSTYKKKNIFYINDKNKLQVLIPPNCVNGHLCLSDTCLFSYKLTEDYVSIDEQISVKWDDKEFDIFWPIKTPILSQRDS